MAKRLIVAKSAYLHLERIIEFNNTRNQSDSYSNKIVKALFKQFHLLQKFPYTGKPGNSENTFILTWNQFYIYYFFVGDTVEITAIYHQKENVGF